MKNRIVSHYKIGELLGSGGMGEVYQAEDHSLSRSVAIKFLASHLAANPEFRARFIHEARAAGSLNHPNIITIHEVSEFEERPFIVMEYVDGESLHSLIKKQELQLASIIAIAMQICEGLRKAHEKGVWHRDIKPANILLNSEGRVKIVDFGLAKLRDATQLTTNSVLGGTCYYMSPEQVRGEKLDQRTDIFSLGVTLYELITRRLPFKGETETWEAVSFAILHYEPEPLARYKRGVSDRLQNIFDRILDKNRETRCPNIASLLADLRREQDFLTKPSQPPSQPLRPTPPPPMTEEVRPSPTEISSTGIVPRHSPTPPQKIFPRRYLWLALAAIGVMILIIVAILASPFSGDKNLNAPANPSSPQTREDFKDSIAVRPPTLAFVRATIVVDPLDAQVTIDGRTFNTNRRNNLQLTIGAHKIRVSKPGYETREARVNLFPGDTTLFYKLEKLIPATTEKSIPKSIDSVRIDSGRTAPVSPPISGTGTVRILVVPYGDIYIDDKLEFQEAESFQEKTLTVGRHTIKVVHPELGERRREIIVERDKTLPIMVDFFKNE